MYILCIKIFFARIAEVTLSTIVTVLTVRNKRLLAAILSFIDVIIWFIAVREALSTKIDSILIPISFASGYAVGTFLGTTISNSFINRKISLQIITEKIKNDNINEIIDNGYAITWLDCYGKNNNSKKMLLIEIEKKKLKNLRELIFKFDKKAFIIINETNIVHNGFFN